MTQLRVQERVDQDFYCVFALANLGRHSDAARYIDASILPNIQQVWSNAHGYDGLETMMLDVYVLMTGAYFKRPDLVPANIPSRTLQLFEGMKQGEGYRNAAYFSNRRMRKTACPVVWEARCAQSHRADPIYGTSYLLTALMETNNGGLLFEPQQALAGKSLLAWAVENRFSANLAAESITLPYVLRAILSGALRLRSK